MTIDCIAKIRNVRLEVEDHGILTCMVDLDYGDGSTQGAGGYELDAPKRDEDGEFLGRVGTAFGMEWIARLMRATGVRSFDQIKGRTIFAVRENDGYNARVIGLKPLPTEPGEPFMFDELSAEHFPATA